MRLCLLLLMLLTAPLSASALGVGDPAPALSGEQMDGGAFDLAALKGKVAVVHFWATWCAACQLEMPALEAVYRRYRGQGLRVIAVSVDRRHDRDAAVAMMEKYHYPALMLNEAAANGFGMPDALPATYVIDQSGTIRAVLQPDKQALSEADFSAAIAPLLGR